MAWAETKDTPFLYLDPKIIIEKYNQFRKIFPDYDLFYSIKANSDAPVLDTLAELGCGFDIASRNELKLLVERKINPEKILFSAPIKLPSHIAAAYDYGIDTYAVDSLAEVDKLAKLAPSSHVYVRLAVDNSGALWPLTRKFGVNLEDAAHLLAYAKDQKLKPIGATFHVGSQNISKENWGLAIQTVARLAGYLEKRSIEISFLNIGGGFPARYLENIPSLDEFGRYIKDEIAKAFQTKMQFVLEPGRAMVAESGVLVATVIGKALRGARMWYYLDIGLFNGLMEAYEKFRYPVITQKKGIEKIATLAGPSCDSVDVIYEEVLLPDLAVGDKVMFLSSGAYTTSYKTYNGFDFPAVVVRE